MGVSRLTESQSCVHLLKCVDRCLIDGAVGEKDFITAGVEYSRASYTVAVSYKINSPHGCVVKSVRKRSMLE